MAQPRDEAPAAWLPAPAPRWQLPFVELINASGYTNLAEPLRQVLRSVYGLDAHLLCHLHDFWPPAPGQETMLAVVAVAAETLPRHWRPVTAGIAQQADFDDPPLQRLLESWLRQSASGAIPARRVAWASPGWRERAEAWIAQQLTRLGLTLAGPITVRKLWSISCVLRVPTSADDYYFKAVPPLFAREPALTATLSQRHPGQIPEVVALDTVEHWMLMRGFSGPMLRESEDLGIWQAALRAYAGLQMAWCDDLDRLRQLSCPDRGPMRLSEQIDDLLADDGFMLVGHPRGLTGEQAAALRGLAPRLKAACGEWAAAGVPLALEHGDYHPENVAICGGQFLVFDWTDGCIAHPFVCLSTLLENSRTDWHAPLTQAYGDVWRAVAGLSQIQAALRLSRTLAPLHMAASYYDIQRAAEPLMRWQLQTAAPYFLRQVLEHQGAL